MPAESGSPQHDVMLPALRCLERLAAESPLATEWLLSAPDIQLLPLLPLAFHPLPGTRLVMAQLLFHVLFGSATRHAANALGRPPPAGPYFVAEPLARHFIFPHPVVSLPLTPVNDEDLSCDGIVWRVWWTQHAIHRNGDAPDLCEPWQAVFEVNCSATRAALDIRRQIELALDLLQAADSHQSCHAVLARLQVLCGTEQGAQLLAQACWRDATSLLLCAAPLSPDDCLLWAELLPLLGVLVISGVASRQDVLYLCDKVGASSGWSWMETRATSPPGSANEAAAHALLLPELVGLVNHIVAHASRGPPCSGPQAELLGELGACRWLRAIPEEQGSYGSCLAMLRQLAVLVAATQHAGAAAIYSAELVGSLRPLLRNILMARDAWCPERQCGKAVALAAGEALLAILCTVPASSWSTPLADVGSTYWLSRMIRDGSADMRRLGFHILAAMCAESATLALLRESWPESGAAAAKAAMQLKEHVAVRAAALDVMAALLTKSEFNESKAMELSGSDVTSSSHRSHRQSLSAEYVLGNAALKTTVQAMIEVRPHHKRCLQVACLNFNICRLFLTHSLPVQSPTSPPVVLASAATYLLLLALLDAEAAHVLCSCGSLERLAGMPSACMTSGEQVVMALADGRAVELRQGIQAAVAAARTVSVLLQLLPTSAQNLDAAALFSALTKSTSIAVQLSCQELPANASSELCSLHATGRNAIAPLLDAVALAMQSCAIDGEHLCTAGHSGAAATLAADIALALQSHGCGGDVGAAACRLLSVALSARSWAVAFLGPEELEAAAEVPLRPVGAALAVQLIELFVSSCATAQETDSGTCGPAHTVVATLRGLLAYSPAAKAAAIEVGLHCSLLQACAAMAATLAKSRHLRPVSSSKLERLKRQRQAAANSAVHIAFGSRSRTLPSVVSSRPLTSSNTEAATQVETGRPLLEDSPLPVPGQQQEPVLSRLLVCLDLLAHLTLDSEAGSDALSAVGLADVAGRVLWEAGNSCPGIMAGLLQLLRNVLANSAAARRASVNANDPPLLERLMRSVLDPSVPQALHHQVVLALSALVSTPDGCTAVLRTSFVQRTLTVLQGASLVPDRQLEGLLSCLAALASQIDGAKALACAATPTPTTTLLELLLAAMRSAAPVATAAALVLRNISLVPSAKAHFLSQSGALAQLVTMVAEAEQQPGRAAHAAGALLGLLHGGERVKAALRQAQGQHMDAALDAVAACCPEQPEGQWKELAVACTSLRQMLIWEA